MSFVKKNVKLLIGFIIFVLFASLVVVMSKSEIAYATAQGSKFGGGNGKQDSPYIIASSDDLVELMNDVNTHIAHDGYFNYYFRFDEDIDLSDVLFSPIGDFTYPFKGIIDGNKKSVTGLNINDAELSYVGLFGVLSSSARVDSLSVYGTIKGFAEIGGIAGLNYGEIKNCKSGVTVMSSDDMSSMDIGGICGYNRGIIMNSYNIGGIVSHGLNSGGVVGINGEEGQVVSCFNVGDVLSDYYSVGGISGHNDGIIEQSFNSAKIKGYGTIGGVSGSNAGHIRYSYNTSTISAIDKMAGGVCGSNEGELRNCYNAGTITAKNTKGGVCGYSAPDKVLERCYFSTDRFVGHITGKNESYPYSDGLRDADMVAVDTLSNANKLGNIIDEIGTVWSKREYDESYCHYPELKCFYNSDIDDIKNISRESVWVARQAVEVRLGLISCEYNGTEQKSDVWLGQERLTELNDYVCEYTDNINAGIASVKVIMTNYYIGESVKEFEITQKPIEIEWADDELIYNGGVQHPIVGKVNGIVGDDEVAFDYLVDGGINVGQHEVTAALAHGGANDNYYIAPQLHKYAISPRSLVVSWDEKELVYNKKAQFPIAEIIDGLVNDDSVELEYNDYHHNIAAGNGYKVTVTVSSNDTNYVLQETKEYSIRPKPISASFEFAIFNYTGEFQYPRIDNINDLEFGDTVIFEYFEYDNNIDIGNHIVYAELSDKESGKNYTCERLSCTYEIKQGIFDIDTIAFSSETFIYDGTEKSLFIVGDLPKDIIVKYDGNGRIAVGKYMVTASFDIIGDRYSFLEPLTAELVICPNEYFSKGIEIEVLDGNIEYGADLHIEVVDANKKFAHEKIIATYSIGFFKDGNAVVYDGRGIVKIPIDIDLIKNKIVKLYMQHDGKESIVDYDIVDGYVIFETDKFNGIFYLTYKKSYLFILWIVLGVLLLAVAFMIALVVMKRKRRGLAVTNNSTVIIDSENLINKTQNVALSYTEEQVTAEKALPNYDFDIDGIYCKSYDSFIAALNYKNSIRQKEICGMEADRAIACSIGKGGSKRRDLYWQGKRIMRDSKEYIDLLLKAKSQIIKKQEHNSVK